MMKNLLQFEFYKLRKMKSFYVCLIVSILLVLLEMISSHILYQSQGITDIPVNSFLVSFTSISMLSMILGIFTALYSCEDYSSNTLKNIYSRGYNRKLVYMVKYIVVQLVALFYMFIILISIALIGMIIFGHMGSLPDHFYSSIFVNIVLLLAYNTIFYAISIFTKKSGTAIAANIVGPTFISLFLSIGDSLLHLEDFSLNYLWIDYYMEHLSTTTEIYKALLAGIIYIVMVYIAGKYIQNKQEF